MKFPKLLNLAFLVGCLSISPFVQAKKEGEVKPASWKVSGQGVIKNFALKRQLNTMFDEEKEFLEAVDIEDAALILLSGLQSEGFLDAQAEATLTFEDESEETIVWDKSFSVVLPRTTKARKVHFKLLPGQISYFEEVKIESNNSKLEQDEIEAFFFSEGLLFQGDSSRVFTPSVASSGAANIAMYLKQSGYQLAIVEAEITEPNKEQLYAKVVTLTIDQGPLHVVDRVEWNVSSDSIDPEVDSAKVVNEPYSRFAVQDLMKSLRNQFYEAGYPDVSVSFDREDTVVSEERVDVSVTFDVVPGDHQTVGVVSYLGADQTRLHFLDSRVELDEGEPLNPVLLEKSRLNLSRVGAFGRVDFATSPGEGDAQDLEFTLEERRPWKVDVLGGWGSYERLRGGISAERLNVWGLGHQLRFRSILSMKSALGEVRYLYPQIFNTNTSVSSKVFALDRDENVYDLKQVGVDLGISSRIDFLDLNADMVYTFESIEVIEDDVGANNTTEDDSLVGSIGLRLSRDRRDNPINPKTGYRFTSSFEWASQSLGGEADYQLAEVSYSKHRDIGRGLYWHAALNMGMIDSFSVSESQIPTGKLFRQGGENSIRGYKRGDASPIDENGNFVGASSYALLNLELEQLLTESLSLILFGDGLAQTPDFGSGPFDEYLYSAGLGLRFKTVMGPVRLEYAHNLNKRETDPNGTFHFAIGYPF